MTRTRLLILPALRAERGPNGGFVLTRKFVDGAREYAERWPGRVTVAVNEAPTRSGNLDHVEVHENELPYELRWATDDVLEESMDDTALALVSLVDRQLETINNAIALGLPTVLVSEYSCTTRDQIIRAETSNRLLQWRRMLYNRSMELKFRSAARRATGIQCNGTPTFRDYGPLSSAPLLYFDTRVARAMLADADRVQRRIDTMQAGGPLRLAFSGRWTAMKGPDHVIEAARHLREAGVDFRLDLCGDGDLADAMTAAVQRHDLTDVVRLRGILDFHDQLVPFITDEVDLFVCAHRQGDPSCTYLETMACGVPIVGYANEAFAGVVETSGVGWCTPLDDPAQLAARIVELSRHREQIAGASHQALAFAAGNTFDTTMDRRIDHMRSCAGLLTRGAAA